MASYYGPAAHQLQPLAEPPAAQLQPLAEPPAVQSDGVTPQAPPLPPPAYPPPAEAEAAMEAVELHNPEQLQAVEVYIAKHHKGSWHVTLNNHASTRPKAYGGPLVHAVTECKSYSQSLAAPGGACTLCHLELPNSFAPSDGRRLQAQGAGKSQSEASESACRQAVAKLLLMEPSQVLLRPAHWKISPDELLAGLPGAETMHQALPVHVPARVASAGEDAEMLTPAGVDHRVAEILRHCLRTHGGAFDPSKISHSALGLGPHDERMYSRLNKLLLPNELRPFVERHPEFSWQKKGPKGMVITWSTPAPASPPGPGPASANQPAAAPSPASASVPAHLERGGLPRA